MEKVWILLLESNKWRLLLHICLTSKARMSQTRRSQKCALIRASTIARLVSEPTLPRKRRAPARLERWCWCTSYFPKLPKITFKKVPLQGLLILSSVLSISALIRNASVPTPRWTHMETLLVKAANGDDYEAEFKYLEASYTNDVDSLRTADGVFSPRSSPQTFLLAKRPSAAMSAEKRLPCAG